MTLFLNQEDRSHRMELIQIAKLEVDYNIARGDNPYSDAVCSRYIQVAQSTPNKKVVYVNDNVIIPLCEVKKGMFNSYEDMRIVYDRNQHTITEDEWERAYMQSCVDAFDTDIRMEDYQEMLPLMEEYLQEGFNGNIHPFSNIFFLMPDGTLAYIRNNERYEDEIHLIENTMHELSTPYGDAIRDKDYKRAGGALGKAVFGMEESVTIIPCMVHDYMNIRQDSVL